MTARARLGRAAEDRIARLLESRGYEILARNARVGRLELDIIARRGAVIAFVEVRARATRSFVHPAETFDAAKRQRVRRAAAQWLSTAGLGSVLPRIDAATVVFDTPEGQVEYYENAF